MWQLPFPDQRVEFTPRIVIFILCTMLYAFFWVIYAGNIPCFDVQNLAVNILTRIALVGDPKM